MNKPVWLQRLLTRGAVFETSVGLGLLAAPSARWIVGARSRLLVRANVAVEPGGAAAFGAAIIHGLLAIGLVATNARRG